MTTTRLSDPERWSDCPPARGSSEDVLGAAFRKARAASTPSEALLARVEAGVLPVASLVSSRRWRLAFAAVAGLLAISGTVGAARGPLLGWARRHGLLAAPAPIAATHVPPRPQVPATARVASVQVPPLAELPRPPVVAPAPRVVRGPSQPAAGEPPRATEPAVEVTPAAVEEARLLRRVFSGLRSGEVGGSDALVALNDYDRRFPSGLLRAEARLARVEALLRLGRRPEALALLDAWDEGALSLTRGARTARGELRAEVGRCPEAVADFSTVLATSTGDDLAGRALYGRGACALRAGDQAAAAAALERYLADHPDGPLAAKASEALARLNARSAPP